MKETGLQGKTCVVPVAVAAVLGMAGMGLVSERAVSADVTSVTDTLNITVLETCTFRNTQSVTFTGSTISGSEVDNFNNSGVHEFNVYCNNSNGYTVSARPYDLTTTGGIEDKIAYTENYTPSGRDGMWTAEITTDTPGVIRTSPVPRVGGIIISSDTNTPGSGTTFTATYSAYVGSITPAGTYTGIIEYTLSSLSGTVNNGTNGGNNGGSGNNDSESGNTNNDSTNNDSNSGNGTADNTGNNPVDNSNGTNNGNSGTNNSNSPTNAAPLATTLNSNNPTYNTSNTYNTANYYGGGGTTPVGGLMPTSMTSGSTSGDAADTTSENGETGTTNSNNGSGSNAGDNYEKPLGVTSTTMASANKDSGMDPMPIVAAGALAAAGVAALALARSGKKEDEKQ